jgi:hypothetical protein
MGASYTNITLCGPDREQIAQCLKQMKRTAYVSPTTDRFTVVYDKETENQNDADLMGLASQLSAAFECPALAVLVDDSGILAYWLFDEGTLADEYNSAPGHLSGLARTHPASGSAERLCAAFEAHDAVESIGSIFQAVRSRGVGGDRSGGYAFVEDLHQDLIRALGMPSFAVSTGYRHLETGDHPQGLDQAVLVKRK